VGRACGNLGCCYYKKGEHARAIALHEECKKIAEEVGDRAGVGRACGNLGDCLAAIGNFDQAVAYCNKRYEIDRELQVKALEVRAALQTGAVLCLAVRNHVRGHSAEGTPFPAPAPKSLSSLSESTKERAQEAGKWLQIALDAGREQAHLQLAHLAFDTGQEEAALSHLRRYLTWCVKNGRDTCRGCGQVRGGDAKMLMCSGKCDALVPRLACTCCMMVWSC
jgi:tetratricopeptide (TPR) repeat protein